MVLLWPQQLCVPYVIGGFVSILQSRAVGADIATTWSRYRVALFRKQVLLHMN